MASRSESAAEAANKAAVQQVIDRGDAVSSQCNAKEGHITYKFLGGVYDGVNVRLYGPFNPEVVLLNQTYTVHGPPKKNSPKMVYRLVDK